MIEIFTGTIQFHIISDQPTTCPKCGRRTDFADYSHTNAAWQIHFCLNENCEFEFLVCEE